MEQVNCDVFFAVWFESRSVRSFQDNLSVVVDFVNETNVSDMLIHWKSWGNKELSNYFECFFRNVSIQLKYFTNIAEIVLLYFGFWLKKYIWFKS